MRYITRDMFADDMVVGATGVDGSGSIRRAGLLLVINMNLGVRPALWVRAD